MNVRTQFYFWAKLSLKTKSNHINLSPTIKDQSQGCSSDLLEMAHDDVAMGCFVQTTTICSSVIFVCSSTNFIEGQQRLFNLKLLQYKTVDLL